MLQKVLISGFVYLQYNRAYFGHFWHAAPLHVFIEILRGNKGWLDFVLDLL